MTSLALEMCAERLMEPYFGTSLLVWASLIGLILIYLTVGYFVGGRLADRHPSEEVLCIITAAAALATSLIPLVSQGILQWSVTGIAEISVSIFLSSLIGTPLCHSGHVARYCVSIRDSSSHKGYLEKWTVKWFIICDLDIREHSRCVSAGTLAHSNIRCATDITYLWRATVRGITMGATPNVATIILDCRACIATSTGTA